MKVLGIVLVAVGAAALAACLAFVVGIVRRASEARVVQTIPCQGESLARTTAFDVSTERLCQISAVFHPDIRMFGDIDSKRT